MEGKTGKREGRRQRDRGRRIGRDGKSEGEGGRERGKEEGGDREREGGGYKINIKLNTDMYMQINNIQMHDLSKNLHIIV